MSQVSQLDFFTVTALDPPLRDNQDTMAYPFLSLQKNRTRPIEYRAGNIALSIAADVRSSIATIWDWDIIIFAAAHLNDAIEGGRHPSPRVRFTPHDCLKQIGRGTSGRHYQELAQAIRRLKMTTVVTNIRQDDTEGDEGAFSWLVTYSIPKRYKGGLSGLLTPDDHDGAADPSRPWEIELPAWLYNSILRRREILAVHPDYFELTGGLERWLYRLARKSVPEGASNPAWSWRMDTLHDRSGTTRPLRNFASDIRKIAASGALPEYGMSVQKDGKHELVVFYLDRSKTPRLPRGLSNRTRAKRLAAG